MYIFGDRLADLLEEKVLEALKAGPLTATELSAALNRHVPRERYKPILQQLEGQQLIRIKKQKNGGRPRASVFTFARNKRRKRNSEYSEKRGGRA